MNDHWYEMFTTSRLLFFLVGVVVGAFWQWNSCRKKHELLDLGPLGIIAGLSIIIFVAIQQVGLADQVKQCNGEFQAILKTRADLSDQSDELSGSEDDATSHWLITIYNPPADIAKLSLDDPARRSWFNGTLHNYIVQIGDIKAARDKALNDRKHLIYPEPKCGK